MEARDAKARMGGSQSKLTTVLVLILLLTLAAFFRVAFNYEPAVNDGEYRFAGNDDYYHLRVVRHVQAEGEHLFDDPLLNYPNPGRNPRPPVYDWSVAMAGRAGELTTGAEGPEAAAVALEWGSAFWGILTVIPIYMLGRTLYSNRAGLWAGFLIAASPAHIQRSGFGLGDHDAYILFFLSLGFYFLVRALQTAKGDERVERWTSIPSIAEGFGLWIDRHRLSIAYAVLAGLSWATIALAWKGFPYVTAIFALYYGFQLLTNQMRRIDSTGDVLIMLTTMGTLTLAMLPYYWLTGIISSTLTTNAYIFGGLVLATLALVPTRDLPSILVLPTLAGIGLVAWLAVMVLFPDIGQTFLSANGYFTQSKLYSTIAEAQRTELGVFVFSIGFMTFFLALVGFGWAVVHFFKHKRRDQLFVVAWGLVSIYMAFAAARFVFNAAPAFAILGGWITAKIVDWMNVRERIRNFRSLRQDSLAKAVRGVMGGKQIAGALFLGLTLIVPNLWFSLDAGLPSEVRQNVRDNHPSIDFINNQTGAFGQGFLSDDWIETYGWLNEQDTVDYDGNFVECEDRPAHMAWWDYGFWEVALACHPTVADNFQNGFEISGRFIAAQGEQEAMEWNTLRLIEGHMLRNGRQMSTDVHEALERASPGLRDALPATISRATYNEAQLVLRNHTPTLDDAVELYRSISEATGFHIGYFLVDQRMFPFDRPDTFDIDSGSIFYAPVYLADKNPDDFVQTVYVGADNQEYRVEGYLTTENGEVVQITPPDIIGPDGREYLAGARSLVRSINGERIDYTDAGGQGRAVQQVKLDLKAPFYQTMFYRAYVGGDGNVPPGGQSYHEFSPANGLEHWRLVHNTPSVRLLKFYYGAILEGTVQLDDGTPVAGARVQAFDDLGTAHHAATTDDNGTYRLKLPFSGANETTEQLDPIRVTVTRSNSEIASREFVVTEAQAMRVDAFDGDGDFSVQRGNLDVFAFLDRDRDGAYNASLDEPAVGANLTFGGQTIKADAGGEATFTGVVPGRSTMVGDYAGYTMQTASFEVKPGETATGNVSFRAATIAVQGQVTLDNGTGVANVPVNVTAQSPESEYTEDPAQPGATTIDGNFTATVVSGGSYVVTVNHTRFEGEANVTYRGEAVVSVPIGAEDPVLVQLVATRAEN